MCALLAVATALTLLPLFSLLYYLILRGYPSLTLSFFTELPKPVGVPGGGMANAILGTLTLISLASLVGIPCGISIGLFLSEYGKSRLSHTVRFCADLLASTPSIIVGLLVYTLVVMPMKKFSALAGGLTLGILMIPTLARSTEELLLMVPVHIREAGLALGLPRWKVILQIVLTGNAKAISTGVMLSVARVAGETAPLLFTAFNNQFWQRGLAEPIASLPVQIYNYAISPYEDWNKQAWSGALILVLLIFIMNITTRYLMSTTESQK